MAARASADAGFGATALLASVVAAGDVLANRLVSARLRILVAIVVQEREINWSL